MSPIVRVLALRSLATVYLAAGRPADAVTAFRELVAKAPAREFSLGLARALLRDGRPAECLELFERLPAEMSGRRGVQLLRGDALLDLGRAGEALEVATALLSREPGDDAALALASEARVAREPEGGAAPEIERLKALLASSAGVRPLPRTRALLAGLLRAQRRDAEAVRVLEAAAVTTNAHRGLLAQIAADHGNLPKAAELYQAMLAERPSLLAPRRELAGLYDRMGRMGEALALYDTLVAADPGNAGLRVDRGATLLKAGRPARAEADLREAVALDDSLPEGRLNLALIELRTGREAEAERDLLRAVELRPDYAKAHFHLAYLYSRWDDPRAAKHAELAAAAGSVLAPTSPPSDVTSPGVASEVGE
jgi:tetratricopeptide (TPR) repeat protein